MDKYDLNHTENKLIQWGHDTAIVEQGTVWAQTGKMLEEVIELIAAQLHTKNPDVIARRVIAMVEKLNADGRIKPVAPEHTVCEQVDAVCDMHVVGTQILSMLGTSREAELHPVYEVLNKRTAGGRMIKGTFVKAKDLPENNVTLSPQTIILRVGEKTASTDVVRKFGQCATTVEHLTTHEGYSLAEIKASIAEGSWSVKQPDTDTHHAKI